MEFAKAYRLTDVIIEPLSFTVPRVKVEYKISLNSMQICSK